MTWKTKSYYYYVIFFSGEPYFIIQQFMHNACEELFRQLKEWLLPKFATYGNQRNSFSYMYDPVTYDYIFHRRWVIFKAFEKYQVV